MSKSEGKEVRVAMNGPDLEHDALIDFSVARNDEDRRRSSSAGESRAKIKEFLDDTGMNGKALSWLRSILKVNEKDDGQSKAMDIILSLKKGLPMIEAHVGGQGTVEMDFDEPAAEPVDDTAKPSYEADDDFADIPLAADPEIEAEADDFERQLASVG